MVRAGALALSLLFFALPSPAEEGGPMGGPMHGRMRERMEEFHKACGGDVQKYCKDSGGQETGMKKHHAMMQCLVGHLDATDPAQSLSDSCKPKVAKAKAWMAKMDALKTACAGDLDKNCPSEKDHPILCLIKNRAKLSAGCKSALPKRGPHPED